MIRHLRDAVAFLLPCTLAALVVWVVQAILRGPEPVRHGVNCRLVDCPARQRALEAAWWAARDRMGADTAPALRTFHGPARPPGSEDRDWFWEFR